jgi:hypothetical protein
MKITAFATHGTASGDERRLVRLLSALPDSGAVVELAPFDRTAGRSAAFRRMLSHLSASKPDLVVMEGTGIAGGMAVMTARARHGIPYVVSSGDAVGPFVGARSRLAGHAFSRYEQELCRRAAGFIGWTPYLTGRALTLGSPRAMTAPGWSSFHLSNDERAAARRRVRARLGIPEKALVAGITGSLAWSGRYEYCYGRELVEASASSRRAREGELHVLVVGDGDGRPHLEALAGARLGRTVHLTGRVPHAEVADHLSAMDLVTLPQSVDGVGSFRYTAKLPEYLALELPVAVNSIPLSYDLPGKWFWRLPGASPWDPAYLAALTRLLDEVTPEALAARAGETRKAEAFFEAGPQIRRVAEFVRDILAPIG